MPLPVSATEVLISFNSPFVDFGNLSAARFSPSGSSSPTRMIFAGGEESSRVKYIERNAQIAQNTQEVFTKVPYPIYIY